MRGKNIYSSLCVALLFALSNSAYTQDPGDLKFSNLTQKDGLSQSTGQTIIQDSQGYMWFGTSNGLNKYNGYDMDVYRHDPDDSTTISGNNISVLYEDKHEQLWVGTNGAGLNLFNRNQEKFIHFKHDYNRPDNGISDNSITSIIELSSGKFWVGTFNGLNFYDTEKQEFIHFFTNPANPKSLSSSYINTLYEDKRGNFWIGTNDGLNIWDPNDGTFSRFLHNPSDEYSISGNDVMKVYEDSKGNLWVGTTEGLNRYNRDEDKFYRYIHDNDDPGSISGNSIFSIMEDSQGILWVGTENNGINAYDRRNKTFRRYKQNLDDPTSINNDAIYTIYENSDNILWIGTYAGGINYVDRKKSKFEYYKYEKNVDHTLSTNSVTSFLEDSLGNFWVGTDGGGLNYFDRTSKEFYVLRHNPNNPNSLSSDVVLALLAGGNGSIWIGYYHGGISKYDVNEKTFEHYKPIRGDRTSLCHNDVFSLYQDKDNNIWVGTNGGGVCKLDIESGEFIQYEVEEGVVRDLLIDSRENFWVATYGGGLKLLDRRNEGIWNFYEGNYGLRSNVVLTIHEDKSKNFWVGTMEAGINLFDRDSLQFKSYNTDHGLPNNEIKGILEDDYGNLWLSTANGLSKFSPKNETFFNYYLEHGLQGNEFNTLAYYKDREGYMYFGGINGFNRFHPDSVKPSSASYPVVFTDFKIFNNTVETGKGSPLDKHISQTEKIVVPYSASVLTFEYAALNFNELKGIRYAYKLEGFEDEWNQVGNKRTTTYTNLRSGNYTLRVRTSNIDGFWNAEEATLALTVTPPFWQTFWFYFLAVLMVGGIIFGGYRFRVRQITRQNRVLVNKVSERTAELNQRNKDLEDALNDLTETRSELIENAHKAGMADIATGVLHNIGNVLNSISTSTSLTGEVLKKSKFEGLFKANKLLIENADNLEEFFTNDPRGKKLIEYYKKLDGSIKEELTVLRQHNERMEKKVQMINDVITAQQNYAGTGLNSEKAEFEKVLDDALIIFSASLERHDIKVKKNIKETPPVNIQKTKLVHVILNILKNAKEAMVESGTPEKRISINIFHQNHKVLLEISDNGIGIKKENLDKVFSHGFTTKQKGHGFGLHSSANYMTEMGGSLKVKSNKDEPGVTFILSFPVNHNNNRKIFYAEETVEG